MNLWVGAQLSPALAAWVSDRFGIEAKHVAELGLLHVADPGIFNAARHAGATIMPKDRDFVDLVRRLGAPPQVLWIVSGNTSNAKMKSVLEALFGDALDLLQQGEPLVVIRART